MHKRSLVQQSVQRSINRKHRSHYLKWTIDGEFSIRYFFVFDDKPQYRGKFVLKSHRTKEYLELSRVEAVDIIQKECPSLEPKEIFSTLERTDKGTGYRRLITGAEGSKCFLEKTRRDKKLEL